MLFVFLKREWKGVITHVSISRVPNAQVIYSCQFLLTIKQRSVFFLQHALLKSFLNDYLLFPFSNTSNYLFLFKECHKFSFGDVIQMRGLYSTEKCSLRFVHMSNLKDTARKVSRVLWGIPSFFWLNRLKKNTNMLQLLQSLMRALVWLENTLKNMPKK